MDCTLLPGVASRVKRLVRGSRSKLPLQAGFATETNIPNQIDQAPSAISTTPVHRGARRGSAARLVEARKHGKYVYYRLTDLNVSDLWVTLRCVAEERLLELQSALRSLVKVGSELQGVDRESILKRAKQGEVVVIDVRPAEEFAAGHLPYARSIPLGELKLRLKHLPKSKPVVAYCRGPFCMMAKDAVSLLQRRGYRAFELADGVAEWQARGLPLER